MSSELEQKIADAQALAESYQDRIRRQKEMMADTTMNEFAASRVVPLPRNEMRVRRVLKGHSNKVYSINWSVDSSSLISASQDGKMIIWDPQTTDKEYAITLRSSWVMTCAYAPSKRLVAAGGLDNTCSIYDLNDVDKTLRELKDGGIPAMTPRRELVGHTGFISTCKFISDNEIITASGDMNLTLWDIERGISKCNFTGHTADIMNFSLLLPDRTNPSSAQTFVSVGCDATARVWDIRSGECCRIYVGHSKDINAIDSFPSGVAFATGSDDGTCRLYDLRADRELMRYGTTSKNDNDTGVTSVSFSKSGRGIFVAYDDTNVVLWDTIKGGKAAVLAGHDQRVACLAVSPDGTALGTASWDTMIKIWA